jgi:hypothetical protein
MGSGGGVDRPVYLVQVEAAGRFTCHTCSSFKGGVASGRVITLEYEGNSPTAFGFGLRDTPYDLRRLGSPVVLRH